MAREKARKEPRPPDLGSSRSSCMRRARCVTKLMGCGVFAATWTATLGACSTGSDEACCEASRNVAASARAADQSADGQTGATEVRSNGGAYFVRFETIPSPIPTNELFSMRVQVLDESGHALATEGISLSADAAMPHHHHGMNVRPRVSRNDDGSFLVRGMQLHMPGYWEIYFDITRDGRTERAQYNLTIE